MLFDIVGDKVQICPESLIVPEFKTIWESDKSKDKQTATNKIAYVVFYANLSNKNPYKNYSEADRKTMLSKDLKVEEDSLILAAIDKYKILTTTRYKRVVTAALDSTDKITEYYKQISSTDADFDITEYLNSLDKLTKGVKSLRDLEKQLEIDDAESDTKVRAGGEIGPYEV